MRIQRKKLWTLMAGITARKMRDCIPGFMVILTKFFILPLLQANLAAMLLCVKTIQEQSVQLARLSDLSRRSSSMSTPYQPTASSTRAHSSCLTQSRMCSKETKVITGSRMVSMASTDTGNVKRLVAKFDTGGTCMKK